LKCSTKDLTSSGKEKTCKILIEMKQILYDMNHPIVSRRLLQRGLMFETVQGDVLSPSKRRENTSLLHSDSSGFFCGKKTLCGNCIFFDLSLSDIFTMIPTYYD